MVQDPENMMYGNISRQPDMQGSRVATMKKKNSGQVSSVANPVRQIPLLDEPIYDDLTPKGKAREYKEGGASVKFDTFNEVQDHMKALTFLQQFDAAYSRGHFTEPSKICKATTFLKGNVLQWWTNILLLDNRLATLVEFKQMFSAAWLSTTFEVDVMTAWYELSAATCKSLEEYNKKFWQALLPIESYKEMPLIE